MDLDDYKALVRAAVVRVANSGITNGSVFGQHMEAELDKIEDPYEAGTILGVNGALLLYVKAHWEKWFRVDLAGVKELGSYACVLQNAALHKSKLRVLRDGWQHPTKSEVDCA